MNIIFKKFTDKEKEDLSQNKFINSLNKKQNEFN